MHFIERFSRWEGIVFGFIVGVAEGEHDRQGDLAVTEIVCRDAGATLSLNGNLLAVSR